MKECDRVLKLNGKLIICYNSRDFIEQTKLTQHGFKTYEPDELKLLLHDCGFVNVSTVSANGGAANAKFYCTYGFTK